MLKILIVDDEKIVLNGLKKLVDWEELGLTICGTASDGQEALTKILEFQPEIVLLDISMPTFDGLDVIKFSRKMGFKGHFIILSGFTKFEYAREAMQYDVKHYLTKPIDSDILEKTLIEIIDQELASKKKQTNLNFLEKNQRQQIIKSLLIDNKSLPTNTLEQFKLLEGPYQVVILKQQHLEFKQEKISFANLLGVDNTNYDYFEEININEASVILLKNKTSQLLVDLHYYNHRHLDSTDYFLAIGRKVSNLLDLTLSYKEAQTILANHFFLPNSIHIATIDDIDSNLLNTEMNDQDYINFQNDIFRCILLKNKLEIDHHILLLKNKLSFSKVPINEIRYSLIDFYLTIKHQVTNKFPTESIPVLDNPQIIYFINNHTHLDIILSLLKAQFHIMASSVGTVSNQTTIDSITFYIQQNYQQNLTLEQLADVFNYNASYLGKLFTKSVGMNFNHYLDQIRIKQAKLILQDPHVKIYEVAAQVGYKNVDYFYKKFRSFEKTSPVNYRKELLTTS